MEFRDAFQMMSSNMQHNLDSYYTSLHRNYGDPRIPQERVAEAVAQQAAEEHAQSTARTAALSDAYEANRQKTRDAHKSRMQALGKRPALGANRSQRQSVAPLSDKPQRDEAKRRALK
jgi:hypothetical protein